jgi:hypothetical protein
MEDWARGYVTDIEYPFEYFKELSPSFLNIAALLQGVTPPPVSREFTYCELGCGQGFTINLLAAANPHGRFYATDFNAAHIIGARNLAQAAGLYNVQFYDEGFEDFIDNPSLPEFDFVVMHGVYSWISDEVRDSIKAFLKKKVRVGGIVYVSYNALPGWSAVAPMRNMLFLHGQQTIGHTIGRVAQAFDFTKKFAATQPAFFEGNQKAAELMGHLEGQSQSYLSHEYMNENWSAFYHHDVATGLAAAKLDYIGSAFLLNNIDALNLTEEQALLLKEIKTPSIAETMKDYVGSGKFRADLFIRGKRLIEPNRVQEQLLGSRFGLVTHPSNIILNISARLEGFDLRDDVYGPYIEAFHNHSITLQEALANPALSSRPMSEVQEVIAVLIGKGDVYACLETEHEARRLQSTSAFNRVVCGMALHSANIKHLASPVVGGGVSVPRLEMLFLMAMNEHGKDPALLASYAIKVLYPQGERIVREGVMVESVAENLEAYIQIASFFLDNKAPMLEALKVTL